MTDEVTASTAASEPVASASAAQPAAQPTAQPAADATGKTPAAAEPAKRELERSPRGAVERASQCLDVPALRPLRVPCALCLDPPIVPISYLSTESGVRRHPWRHLTSEMPVPPDAE